MRKERVVMTEGFLFRLYLRGWGRLVRRLSIKSGGLGSTLGHLHELVFKVPLVVVEEGVSRWQSSS